RAQSADAGTDRGALHALPLASGQPVRRAHARGASQSVRRPSREDRMTPEPTLAEQLSATDTVPVAADALSIVIFGGAGVLAQRKLLPALYNLHVDGLLTPRYAIVGVSRNASRDERYRPFAAGGG